MKFRGSCKNTDGRKVGYERMNILHSIGSRIESQRAYIYRYGRFATSADSLDRGSLVSRLGGTDISPPSEFTFKALRPTTNR